MGVYVLLACLCLGLSVGITSVFSKGREQAGEQKGNHIVVHVVCSPLARSECRRECEIRVNVVTLAGVHVKAVYF
eukprot:1150340-Pelagomonas_calceolata.AAC.8